jgi:sec-independent protein translocase protein TatC
MCFDPIDPKFLPGKVTGKFMTAMLVALIGAVIIGFPYILWELWKFLKPALYPKEKKSARGIVFFSSILFACGIFFGYFIINPLSVHFLIGFDLGTETLDYFPMNSFMGIVASTTLAAGVMFELPVLVYFLSKAGVVSPEGMKKYRKHSFVATLIIAAIITPPDVVSQVIVAIPIVILYELSIFISRSVNKRREL